MRLILFDLFFCKFEKRVDSVVKSSHTYLIKLFVVVNKILTNDFGFLNKLLLVVVLTRNGHVYWHADKFIFET